MITASLQVDANRKTVQANEAFVSEAPWTFVTATTGATGAHTLFTVTGNVLVSVFAVCDTNLTGAGTIEVGVAGNTAALIPQIADATTLDDGEVWVSDTALVGVGAIPATFVVNDGADIILTIGSTAITAGAVDFYCTWRPLSSGASVTVATPA